MSGFTGLVPEGVYKLTQEAMDAWQEAYPEEFAAYVDAGALDPTTGVLNEAPDWMVDGDWTNGPFDLELNPSQWTIGW